VIRSPLPLYAGAVGFGLLAIALRLAPVPHASAVLPAKVPEAAERPALHGLKEDPAPYGAIVANNIFSPSRAPPAVRFTPNRPTGLAPPPPPPKPKPSPKRASPAIRLVGITKGSKGALALIEADPKTKGAELYRVGDRVAGARISAIDDSTVFIARPQGRLMLRLPSAVKTRKP
jgi:hypothetical protein